MICPYCGSQSQKTAWLPEPGNEPSLREYQCLGETCRQVFYQCTGRLIKVEGQDRGKDFQPDMFPVLPREPKER